jgi:hypothetical protein
MGNPDLSKENRTRLFYLVGDFLEKPLMDGFGGFEGASDFFVLNESSFVGVSAVATGSGSVRRNPFLSSFPCVRK